VARLYFNLSPLSTVIDYKRRKPHGPVNGPTVSWGSASLRARKRKREREKRKKREKGRKRERERERETTREGVDDPRVCESMFDFNDQQRGRGCILAAVERQKE